MRGSFLAYVDLLGTTYSASTLATGYGAYIALPLLRQAVEGREATLEADEARRILTESMRVLFYRDARSLNKVRPLPAPRCARRVLKRCRLLVPDRDSHRGGRGHLGADRARHRVGLRGGHPGVRRTDAVSKRRGVGFGSSNPLVYVYSFESHFSVTGLCWISLEGCAADWDLRLRAGGLKLARNFSKV